MNKFSGAFFSGYIFITLAFIGQLVCAYIAFKADNLKKMFYNLPLITLSYTGLILTLILGGAAMAIPDLPNWSGAVICLLILGFNAIAIIKAKAAAEIVESVDRKISRKSEFIKNLTCEAESLISHAKSEKVKSECKKVYEAVRFSDPMSEEQIADIENLIIVKICELKSSTDKAGIINELNSLLEVRNKKIKFLK